MYAEEKKRKQKVLPDCKSCKWRFGDIKEKCIACGRASEFVSFELREEKQDGIYNKVPSE